ncbi:MAG: flavodoxin family protein [Pseudomonadota bacterium]
MKVMAVLGSPRKKGYTSQIAEAFMESAQQAGAETKIFHLNRMNYRGCQGCNACKTKSETCVQEDDLTEVLHWMHEADVAVFAVPVYYWDVTGQFKCFFDRTWSLVKPDYTTNPRPSRLAPGKKAVLITAQGDVTDKHRDVVERYSTFLAMYGYKVQAIRAVECGLDAQADIGAHADEARELAAKLVK